MSTPYAEVIGDPIAQSKSPIIHGYWLEQLGVGGRYDHCHVTADDLAGYVRDRRADPEWLGCNVTMPHKRAIMPLLDVIDAVAARIGAVNTVVRDEQGSLVGYNTDAPGFLEPLFGRKFETVTVVGAGGAARAVLAALADSGTKWITIQNRSLEKAEALLSEFDLPGYAVELGSHVRTADLLVNTSALGMAGQPPLPPLLDCVSSSGIVYDIVTSPLDTALLREARERGLTTVDGLSMLIGQADHAFARFFGLRPPRRTDAELRHRILQANAV
ncbi:shikimate dehydrogenase [Novosphingobium sp. RD2P27]|uniref:Shikimate dehydrogenase (NADP(+)) n=1 Tax=Novosphingobium kalidii TaxID=3230299 RepID=A0ABV2D4V1_9SPHN